MENTIREFWRCSLKSDFSEFDWAQAFEEYEPHLAENCIAHGQGTLDEYRDYLDNIYGLNTMECDIPEWAKYDTGWGCFSDVDACDALIEAKYNFMKENFSHHVHSDNAELLERVRSWSSFSEPELIQLFDECIHAQHATGTILDDVDVDDLRSEMEREYEIDKKRFPTNIREFLTV